MRILIVKLSSIGDVVHALPAAALLRRALPDAHITWVVERRAGAILTNSPAIDRLVEIDSRAWRGRPLSPQTLAELKAGLNQLRKPVSTNNNSPAFDIAIDLQGLIKSGIVAGASGARRRIGFESDELRETPSCWFLTEQVKTAGIKHVIEKNLAVARAALGLSDSNHDTTTYEFPIGLSPEDQQFAESIALELKNNFAVLNPGGGWPTKLWSAERFGQLADSLFKEHGLESLVTHGPGEESLAARVAASAQSGAARPVVSTLKQFTALVGRARLFVGCDTGPLHIAAACRTPIVGIYGPTSPERNGPFDRNDVTVGLDLWCRPDCHRRSCWHWECMEIPVSVVTAAASARLANSVRKFSA
jgi:lipopolysaccharide heptosyltransferase I